MKVILLKGVSKLGNKDQIVEVPDGYAQNALFPKRLAVPATKENLNALNKKLSNKKSTALLQGELLSRALKDLEEKPLVMKVRTNESGHLFAKIHSDDISKYIEQTQKISIESKMLKLDEPIKQTGTYLVPVVGPSFKGTINLKIESI